MPANCRAVTTQLHFTMRKTPYDPALRAQLAASIFGALLTGANFVRVNGGSATVSVWMPGAEQLASHVVILTDKLLAELDSTAESEGK
jgi:hypothetical protein